MSTGMEIGEKRENASWQKDLLNTVSKTAEKDLANVITNKGMYGREGQPAARNNNNMNYGPDEVSNQSVRRDSVIEQVEPEGLVVENLDHPSAARRPNIGSDDNTRIFNLSEASRRRPLSTREQSLFGPKQNPGNNVIN
ncbi:hypothetical protein GGP41_007018 [Bipolaris sorokiniana]|nr:hypothetical protein GGP41_007018 [Bipolaris sorokiniana]